MFAIKSEKSNGQLHLTEILRGLRTSTLDRKAKPSVSEANTFQLHNCDFGGV